MLLGMLMPAPSVAEGWAPVVSTVSKAEALLSETAVAPAPRPRSADKKKAVPVAAVPAPVISAPPQVPTAALSNADPITTGSIGSVRSTRMPSPADSSRLFADEAASSSSDLTTGAVDGPGSDLARGYCVSIAVTAADARIAVQKAKLADVEKEIGKRMAALEAKTNEYKAWVERRDQFMKRATGVLVKIYTQMEPDAAALQLTAMDEETAAALLVKLEPQNASAVLNEMSPDKAARLAATIAGAARTPKPGVGAPTSAAPPAQPGSPERSNPGEGR